jgi:hypothetical protein
VAAKLAKEKYGPDLSVVYCDTSADEHPDNIRFLGDVGRWLGQCIVRIRSTKYRSVEDVFTKRRYMGGVAGAPCTVELKRVPRLEYEDPADVHVFGLTSDEPTRIKRMVEANPGMRYDWILSDSGVAKRDCIERLTQAGISLPAMYRLGYEHNNCLGCVKATSPAYWNAIRRDFPAVFARRAEQSRALGARLVRVRGERVFLDELDVSVQESFVEQMECGPDCGVKP